MLQIPFGFAVPINVVKPIIESFIKTGEFSEATIGIFAYDKEVLPYLDKNIKFEGGIYIEEIQSGGAAQNAGLRVSDIIKKIDGIQINTMNDLREYIYTKKPGDVIEVEILRGAIPKTVNLALGSN